MFYNSATLMSIRKSGEVNFNKMKTVNKNQIVQVQNVFSSFSSHGEDDVIIGQRVSE